MHTRTAAGWAESADSKGDDNEAGGRDDLDGLSQDQLQAIKTQRRGGVRAGGSTERSQ